MSLITSAIRTVERAPLPDPITRLGIALLVGRTRRRLSEATTESETAFASEMGRHNVAEHPDAANRQHYELPPDFFRLTLGPHRKYSCCLYDDGTETLGDAESKALAETVAHADLANGQRILELGCGWGSLTLFMAERYPSARITAVSNSKAQGSYIAGEAIARGLANVSVVTADMNDFDPGASFDRVVSVEMFEHMTNWQTLLGRIRSWLAPEGRLFIHIFTHRNCPYLFDHSDKTDWIAQHFFTGGIMPSQRLIYRFPNLFEVEQEWRWSGVHYQRTALDWLANFDANKRETDRILADTYGAEAAVWRRRWRLFFLATAGLFGDRGGEEWGVNHYRLRPMQGH